MLAFEVGDLSVWVDNTLPDGVRFAYGDDGEGARALVISVSTSADAAIRLVKQFAGHHTSGVEATVRLLQTA